ncbi:MAG: amino acid adenylation domain-containing protein [Gemmatimonadota bacterium]
MAKRSSRRTARHRELRTDRRPARSGHGDGWLIAVNDEEQHALWPAALTLPPGWRRSSAVTSRQACLAGVAAAWRDIAPASVRRPAGPGESGRRAHGPGGRRAGTRSRDPRCVHQLFQQQAARRPHAPAVACGPATLTYGQLARSANQLAHHLRGLGVGPEVLVGVCLERGIEAIRCLLAILQAGGAYLPLDPALPAARLTRMCEQAGPAVILAGGPQAGALAGTGATLVPAGELAAAAAAQPGTAPPVSVHPGNLAYVIHTSGSTGAPKAVAVSHGSLARLSREASREYRISPRDRVAQLASPGVDTSLEQIFVTLLSGGTLLLPPAGVVAPADLLRYVPEQRVTVLDLTPAYWHQLLAAAGPGDERLSSIRLMITGGEMADWADCRAAMAAAGGARLVNAYGLTETTITSTVFDARTAAAGPDPDGPDPEGPGPGPDGPVPAGAALPHTQVLILGEDLAELPAGEVGEIYIGGAGVARGYRGQPALTAERFLPNPHSSAAGSRMYRTGDLGRWLEGQNLQVTGRADRQVKIRGFRVEPAEVERALTEHPDIAAAAVIAHEPGPGNTRLTAYYRRQHGGRPGRAGNGGQAEPLPAASLRAFLAARLPGFMVPAEFVPLQQLPQLQLPVTPRGEAGQQQPADAAGQASHGPAPGPGSAVQAGVSLLWSEILKTQRRIGPDDDFFSLGGNSLLAAEMLARARVMFGIGADCVQPLTRCLLRDPTLRSFSEATQAARAGTLNTGGAAARIDFARESELDVPVNLDAADPPDWQRPRQILLTGAAGFFGVHLLRELLASTTATVHCLVRARDAAHARQRIADAAQRYELGGLAMDRVAPVAGDLTEPGLGLPARRFRELARTLDVIYHAGAMVNFIYPYTELRAANVGGTRELIRLAAQHRGIPVHYVSTMAVLAGFGVMGVRDVTEDTPLAFAEQLGIGYVETKFVAEELLRRASRAGLPVTIYRPLDIVGDHRTGAWNTATEMCALIRFMADTGLAPDIDLPLDFVPADICAAAIGYLSTHTAAKGATYHLSSPRQALLGSLVDRLRHHGWAVQLIPYQEWVGELLRYAAHDPAHPMSPFVPLFVDRCPDSGLTVAEMYLGHIFPACTRSNTERALRGSGIAFPPVADGLLDLHISRLVRTGYLPGPGTAELPHPPGGKRAR